MRIPPSSPADFPIEFRNHPRMSRAGPWLLHANFRNAKLEFIPGPLPSTPPPARDDATECVVSTDMREHSHVGAGNKGNAWIKPISLQHHTHILEECRRRQAIIFEDDAFTSFAQEPRNRGAHTQAAAEVGLGKLRAHLARPVHCIDQGPDLSDPFGLPCLAGPGGITSQEQLGRPGRAHRRKNSPRGVRPVEGDD